MNKTIFSRCENRRRGNIKIRAGRIIGLAALPILLVCCAGGFQHIYQQHLIRNVEDRPGEGLTAAWMGTAGFYFTDGVTAILVDPFVTRFDMLHIGLGFKIAPDPKLVDRWIEKLKMQNVKYVIVSHSHYDHALDAPLFAKKLGAVLVGSESVANVGRGAGLSESSLKVAAPGEVIESGGFRIRMLKSRHSLALFGKVPYPGVIDKPLVVPAPASEFKVGGVFSVLIETEYGSVLQHSSAAIEPGMFDGVSADLVLLAIAGRESTEKYLREVVIPVGAGEVIPIHFDDFFMPLDDPIRTLLSANLPEFVQTTREILPEIEIATMPIGVRQTILSGRSR